MDQPAPVSFRRDVIPAFSQASCNMGACHGTPTGKGGFGSACAVTCPTGLRDPSREVGGRRINPIAPETSLILRKPLGEVPHEGGLRLARRLQDLTNSSTTGSRKGPRTTPPPRRRSRLEILPESRVLERPASTQQVVVLRSRRRQDRPRRDADLLLRFVQPGDRRGRRRRLRSLQDRAARWPIIAHYLNLVANVRLDPPGRGSGLRPGAPFPRTT